MLNWSAHGRLRRVQVALLFQLAGARKSVWSSTLRGRRPRRLRGRYSWELSPLRLARGRQGDLRRRGAGQRRGRQSAAGRVGHSSAEVFSAAEHSREALLRAQALWERLVALAADRIDEKPAPRPTRLAVRGDRLLDQRALQLVSELQLRGRPSSKTSRRRARSGARCATRELAGSGGAPQPRGARAALARILRPGRRRSAISRARFPPRSPRRRRTSSISRTCSTRRGSKRCRRSARSWPPPAASWRAWPTGCARRRRGHQTADSLRGGTMRERIQDLMARMQEMARASATST